MQKLLLICLVALFSGALAAQPLFVDEFDDGVVTPDTDLFDFTEENGELTITGNGSDGDWDGVWFQLPQNFDVTETPKLYIRAKASVLGTQIRADLTDGTNYTNIAPITQTLTDEYRVLEYDFTGTDVGDLDLTAITAVFIFINPGSSPLGAAVALDYMALGEEPAGVITSDIYQDHMDSDSSLASWQNEVVGFTRERRTGPEGDSTVVTLIGDGTAGPWTPHAYALRPAPEFIQTSVDMSDNPIIYVKARTDVPGTSFRVDIQDTDNISSTANAVTRILTDEYVVYEYDLTGANQSFPNDACPTADVDPCFVNLESVKELLVYVNGGTGQFAGTIDIDWVSFGVNLDGEGPEALLVYEDQFDNDSLDWTGGVEGLETVEMDGSLFINGNATSSMWATVSYEFHEVNEDETGTETRVVNMGADGGQGKLFLRARTAGTSHPLRIDVVDSTSLASNNNGITKLITSEWTIFTYDFNGATDAGYGGAEQCTPENPCPVDLSIVDQIFFYPRPGEETFEGTIEIDWISIGQPLEEQMLSDPGEINYSDTLVGAGEFFSGTPSGVTYSVSDDGYLTLAGDGSSPTYQQVRYTLRNEDGSQGKADAAGSGDVLYVRARALGNASTDMRIDVVDEFGFESTNAGSQNAIAGEEFMTYEYRYSNYEDGGYGGTSCSTGPCPVDPQRITQLVFYPAPDNGGFTGQIDINWISFGEEISVNVSDFAELDGLRIFPNPANDQLGVEYTLPGASQVTVSLFDGLGRRLITRDLGQRAAGQNFHALNVSELATGTYYLQVAVNGQPVRAQTVLKR